MTPSERSKMLLDLSREHGHSPLTYPPLLDRKMEFLTMDGVRGYLPYRRTRKSLIALGGPVCSSSDVEKLVHEFKALGKKEKRRALFFAVDKPVAGVMERAGYSKAKVADDTCIHIRDFTLKGNKMLKVRRGCNRAKNVGMVFHEYQHSTCKNVGLEEEMSHISKKSLGSKSAPELEFIIRKLSWDDLEGMRVFYAKTKRGIEGFLVFDPIYGGKESPTGWYLDISRRRPDSPNGTTDFLISEAIEVFRREGAEHLYMGMVPHVQFTQELHGTGTFSKLALGLFANNFGVFYPVASERFFKEKYRPAWSDLYICSEQNITFGLMYDIFKTFLPKGFIGVIRWKLAGK